MRRPVYCAGCDSYSTSVALLIVVAGQAAVGLAEQRPHHPRRPWDGLVLRYLTNYITPRGGRKSRGGGGFAASVSR